MKKRLAQLLVCPKCKSGLELEVFGEDSEIREGILRCNCGSLYPIVNYIPRMLKNALSFHPDFISTHERRLGSVAISKEDMERYERLYRQTKERFEFQWKTWGKEEKIYGRTKEEEKRDYFNVYKCKQESEGYFKGKLVLEGGCGHGRYVQMMAELGAEVIGVDLGEGVEVAHGRVSKHQNAHIVQADILALPFREGQFDYVYSLGVIHHTPDTRRAFSCLASLVRNGGLMKIWVYPKEAAWWEISQPAIRSITTRLPPKLLYYLAYPAVPLLYFVRTYSGTTPAKNSWRECVQCIYDWYSPEYQTHHTEEEVAGWFGEEGFSDFSFSTVRTGVSGAKAR